VAHSGLDAKAARIKLILLDVDGVLTDGRVLVHSDGSESKAFFIRDGIAMVWARERGLRVGLLSGRASPTTPHRAAQLGITLVRQGVPNKLEAYESILADEGLTDPDVAYMGDDLVDLAVLGRVGLSAAPADAAAEVRARVDWTSTTEAAHGAAREFIEMILRAQGRWDGIVAGYLSESSDGTTGASALPDLRRAARPGSRDR
jgi:3-deoxy-D-manno-octulosonate 8-phosphate phosphatase (KDO 8-P phosphatase)